MGEGGVVMVRGESVLVDWADDAVMVRGGVSGYEEAMVSPLSEVVGKFNGSTDMTETNHWCIPE